MGVELYTVLSLTLAVSKDLGEDCTVNLAIFKSGLAHTETDEVVHPWGGHEAFRAMETKLYIYGKANCKFAPWDWFVWISVPVLWLFPVSCCVNFFGSAGVSCWWSFLKTANPRDDADRESRDVADGGAHPQGR